MVSDLEAGRAPESEPKPSGSLSPKQDRTRAVSLTSLDGAVRTLRIRCPTKETQPSPEKKKEVPVRRITFVDYLIKPIQRICKYPLLLDQLLSASRPSRPSLVQNPPSASSDADVVVKSASQAMRHVASAVDEARHRHDAALQSSLISSRMFFGGQMLMAASGPTLQIITSEFMASLGSVALAGALDVIQHRPLQPMETVSNFKAKYLGAFLYPGGYLVLVKVFKGKKYEPKHWFSLTDFAVADGSDGEGIPSSILCYSGRLLDLQRCCPSRFIWPMMTTVLSSRPPVRRRKTFGWKPYTRPCNRSLNGPMNPHQASNSMTKEG
jgi:RhoGEF domain